MKLLTHLRTRIFDTPLAIQPHKAEIILAALGERLGLEIDAEDILAARSTPAVQRKSYSVTKEGIAVIPIQGTLMKKTSGLAALSGSASYEELSTQIEDAFTDPNVKGILLDIDSPGGEVHGMFELADLLFSLRGQKPLYAVANDGAYSAAYALASSADRVYVTRTGGVGSVGVFSMHVDQSAADQKEGVKYTFVKAGAHKTAGNSHEPLSDDARSSIQAEVDREYEMFCALVARNRSVDISKVKATEADVFFADAAIPLLADAIGTVESAMADLVTTVGGPKLSTAGVTRLASSLVGATTTTDTKADSINTISEAKTQMADQILEEATVTAEVEPEAIEPEAKKAEDVEETCDDKACDEKADAEEDKKDEEDEFDVKKASMITRIVNLCSLANLPELAASYINQGLTDRQVEKMLLEQRAAKSNATKVSTTIDNTTGNSTSAFDRIEIAARQLAKDEKITKAQAYADLLRQNPQLYDAYLDERDSAAETRKATKEYVAAMQVKLNSRGK